MRLYDSHAPTLESLSASDIELMVGIPETDLPRLAKCQRNADSWVAANITCYPRVRFRYIAVGNEINPSSSQFAPFVFPAMRNIYRAICTAGLRDQIVVSTSIKTDVLERSSPPKDGEFRSNDTWYLKPIVEFLRETNATLLVNVYPYFAYLNDMKNISLAFALLQPDNGVFLGGVYYDNLFYAILDAVYSAMERVLATSPLSSSVSDVSTPGITVSETGHPTRGRGGRGLESCGPCGDGDPATVENARIYNNNLMRIVKKGSPKRPDSPTEAYIFAMFDENLKPGPEDERHFGIFRANGKYKYPLRFY